MPSKALSDIVGSDAKDQKSVRFVDPPSRFDSTCSSAEFGVPVRRKPEMSVTETEDNQELPAPPQRDPQFYCTGRRGSLPEGALHEGIKKADGSPVQSILKKGKITKCAATGSDSSLASNPWSLSRESNDGMMLIPQRHTSEDLSTDDSLEAYGSDQVGTISRPRRESNREVFLRQFHRKI